MAIIETDPIYYTMKTGSYERGGAIEYTAEGRRVQEGP
jgi:hypothetical protein